MKISNMLSEVRNSYKMSYHNWIRSFEKNSRYILDMQLIDETNSNYRFAIDMVQNGSKVLSCGCGAGREVKMLMEKNCEVTAIDTSKFMIDKSKEMNPDVEHIVGDATRFKREGYYDYIICLFNTINCIGELEDRKRFVKNCYKNLRYGGILIIETCGMTATPKIFLRALLQKHNYYYAPSQIKKWFNGTGFRYEILKRNDGYIIKAVAGVWKCNCYYWFSKMDLYDGAGEDFKCQICGRYK